MTRDLADAPTHLDPAEPGVCRDADDQVDRCAGPVTFAPDPYADELGEDDTPEWMCEEHRYQSAQAI